jgi:NADH-quinone oxidoreductase subunit N
MTTLLNLQDFAALSPLLILLAGALLMLLLESFTGKGRRNFAGPITLLILALAIGAAVYAPASQNPLLTPWLRFDALAKIFTLFFLVIGIGTALLAQTFLEKFEATQGEYYFLLLSSLFGLILIGASADFLILFLGLETLSISLYVLCGYIKKWKFSHEASIKYFFMGSLAAAFLLYGIALIYGAVGTLQFNQLMEGYQASNQVLFLSGIALITVGLAFKAAIVPLHVWAPDVYDGAPTPVTAFMAVGTKAGAFAAFVLVFLVALPQFNPLWNQTMALLAFPTLIYANVVALRQVQLRRFFAYSGIAHAGYLIIPLAVGTAEAIPALLFYLVVYALSTLGCFAVLAILENSSQGVMIEDLKGLFHRAPFLAAALAICLLTLSGLPPLVGFFAKFYLFKLGFQAGYYSLVIVALLTTIVSAFYYLRLIGIMYVGYPSVKELPIKSWPAAFVGISACAVLVLLSCYPAFLMTLFKSLGLVA